MTNQSRLDILLNLKDNASAGIQKATRTLQNHQQTFRKASIFMAGAAGLLGAALFMSARAGRDYQNALDSLKGSIERSGGDFEAMQEKIRGTVEEIASSTNFTRAEVIEALQNLTDMTGDPIEALALLALTMDVASQRTVGMETAARNVNRAVNEGAGELVENYLPALRDTEDRTERLRVVTEKYGGAAKANADPLKVMTSALTDLLVALGVTEIVNTMARHLTSLGKTITANFSPGFLKAVGIALVAIFATLASGAALAAIAGIVAGITGLSLVIGGIVIAIGALVIGIILLWKNWDTVWGFIKGTATTVWEFIRSLWESKWGWLLPGRAFYRAVTGIWHHWDAIWTAMKTTVSVIWGAIGGVVTTGVNIVIDKINKLIQGVNLAGRGLSFIPGVSVPEIPEIPTLAHGGIVRRPTLAMIGERGPEAVIPLGRGLAGAGAGGGVIVNIEFPAGGVIFLDNESNKQRLAQILVKEIRDVLQRQRGF